MSFGESMDERRHAVTFWLTNVLLVSLCILMMGTWISSKHNTLARQDDDSERKRKQRIGTKNWILLSRLLLPLWTVAGIVASIVEKDSEKAWKIAIAFQIVAHPLSQIFVFWRYWVAYQAAYASEDEEAAVVGREEGNDEGGSLTRRLLEDDAEERRSSSQRVDVSCVASDGDDGDDGGAKSRGAGKYCKLEDYDDHVHNNNEHEQAVISEDEEGDDETEHEQVQEISPNETNLFSNNGANMAPPINSGEKTKIVQTSTSFFAGGSTQSQIRSILKQKDVDAEKPALVETSVGPPEDVAPALPVTALLRKNTPPPSVVENNLDDEEESVGSWKSSNSELTPAAVRRKSIRALQKWRNNSRRTTSTAPTTAEDGKQAMIMSSKTRRATLTILQEWKEKAKASSEASRRYPAKGLTTLKEASQGVVTEEKTKKRSTTPIIPSGDLLDRDEGARADSSWLSEYYAMSSQEQETV